MKKQNNKYSGRGVEGYSHSLCKTSFQILKKHLHTTIMIVAVIICKYVFSLDVNSCVYIMQNNVKFQSQWNNLFRMSNTGLTLLDYPNHVL